MFIGVEKCEMEFCVPKEPHTKCGAEFCTPKEPHIKCGAEFCTPNGVNQH